MADINEKDLEKASGGTDGEIITTMHNPNDIACSSIKYVSTEAYMGLMQLPNFRPLCSMCQHLQYQKDTGTHFCEIGK